MENTCVIGLDLGTTSAKAIALDGAERAVATFAQDIVTNRPVDGAAEQAPAQVAAAAIGVLRQALAGARAAGYRVTGVGISGAMHSLIALDDHDQPLTQALLWQDNRASHAAAALWDTPEGRAIYAQTGTPIHAMSPLAKLLWLRASQPDLWQLACRFVSLKEWIWHELTGAWEVDVAIASATGLYNLAQGGWDAAALSAAAVAPAQLSTLVSTTYTVPAGARGVALGLDPEIQLTIGASDGVLANLGVGALAPGVAALTIGTSSAIRVAVAAPWTDAGARPFCYVLDQGRFIAGAPSNNGGVVLAWLARQLAAAGDLDGLMDAAALSSPGAIVCLPYLAGERAPLWDADASASFVGVKIRHGAGDLMRAAAEGILYNARWLGEALPVPPNRVIASGRVLAAPWLRQIVADLFGVPVLYDGQTDASAIGAVRLARIATGALPWNAIQPDGNAAISTPAADSPYPAFYQRFRAIAGLLDPLGP